MNAAVHDGITVIVRTIGRASLVAALASVRAQGRGDVQCVVVDAQGQGLPGFVAAEHERVVGQGRPLHRTEAAQAGLDAAKTRHALFLDDDDVLLEGHLDKLAAALAAEPDAVLAYTGVELVALGAPGAPGAPGGPGAAPERRGAFDTTFSPWELLLGNRIPIHAALFNLERTRAAGAAFDRSLDVYEDWDFWLQLAMLGRFIHVPGISARYHVHDEASQVHALHHGDAPFWRVWRKWWPRAPEGWWNEALGQREVAAKLHSELGHSRVHGESVAAQLRGTEAQLQQTATRLAATEHTLQQREAELQQRSQQLLQREAELGAERCLREHRERELSSTRTHAEGLAVRVRYGEELAVHLRAVLAATDLQRRRGADELATVRASPSWRLSAPLRSADSKARGLVQRAGQWRRRLGWTPGAAAYRRWIDDVEAPEVAARHAAITPLLGAGQPRVSVLMPVFEPELHWLDEAIESLVAQTWPHWELCIADDASTRPGVHAHLQAWCAREPRLRLVRRASNGGIAAATNDALALAQGDWVAFFDQDDCLAPQALAELALAVHAGPEAELIYSDEDKLDARGRRVEPHLKGSFSVERLRGQNVLNHLVALKRTRLLALGGLREGFDGAQDHELLLRATEALVPAQVHHIPQVLYHWRTAPGSTAASASAKAGALQASLRAVNESLRRSEPGAEAEGLPRQHWLRVRYPVPAPRPAVQGFDAGAGDDAPFVLMCDASLRPLGEGWFEELLSLVSRPGVAVVGGVVLDAQGRWIDAANAPPEAFGARRMVQGAELLPAVFFMMRREVEPQWRAALADSPARDAATPARDAATMARFCDAVRASGARVLWTPFASAQRSS